MMARLEKRTKYKTVREMPAFANSICPRGFAQKAGTLVINIGLVAVMLGVSLPLMSQNVSSAVSENPAFISADEQESSKRTAARMPEIGAGDLLKVSVFGAPESDQEVRVNSDGNIVLNFIGAVHVAGLTNERAQTLIADQLKHAGFFNDPQVSVFTREYATQGVSVLGEVQKPGVYPVLGARRLFDVISLAGGTTEKSGKFVTVSHREQPDTPLTVAFSNDPTEAMSANVEIMPGDTVIVSKAGIVYVVGDVHKPSGVLMEKGSLTVLQALAVAEGTNPTAALNSAKLIRKTSDGHQEIPLQLKDMLSAKIRDIPVQADDIIFVPSSAAKTAGRRSLEAIVQAATGLAVYRR
jgi:polysaccharide export outer membrane protein